MGFPSEVQLIQRKDSQLWYINFPSAVAQAMEFSRGKIVEWIVEDKNRLLLRRRKGPATAQKNQPRQGLLECAVRSAASGLLAAAHLRAGAHLGPFRPDLFGPSHDLLPWKTVISRTAPCPGLAGSAFALAARIPASPLPKPSRCCAPTSGPLLCAC